MHTAAVARCAQLGVCDGGDGGGGDGGKMLPAEVPLLRSGNDGDGDAGSAQS